MGFSLIRKVLLKDAKLDLHKNTKNWVEKNWEMYY